MRAILPSLAGLAWLALPGCGAASAAPVDERVLDDFRDLSAWTVEASEGVQARLRAVPGRDGGGMCLDYDFGPVSGYAIARRALPLSWPGRFALTFGVRGEGGPDALQVKLVDASGQNVWWREQPRFRFPGVWTPMRIRSRDIAFAWGPAADHALTRTASLEFAVARGEGRQGSACFDRLALRSRDVAPTEAPIHTGAWEGKADASAGVTRTVDLGAEHEVGGLVLHWLPGRHASQFTVEVSEDGARWTMVRRVSEGAGGVRPIRLGDLDARFVRLHLSKGPSAAYALSDLEVRGPGFGATPNAFFTAVAREAPRGRYPRSFSGEQSYWTVVGVDGGSGHALFSEDGALEARAGEAALEPLLLSDDGLVTWAHASITHSLAERSLPIPSVEWRRGDLRLRVTAFAAGDRASAQAVARYTLTNASDRARKVTLVLALRPFQVNPPAQFLNSPGGVARLDRVAWDGRALAIDGVPRIFPLEAPDAAFAVPFDVGNLTDLLASGMREGKTAVEDETGFASAALLFDATLPPRGERDFGVVVPLVGEPRLPSADAASWMKAQERAVADAWRERLGRVVLRVPPQAQALADALRTATAHILIERSGPALQPGVRSYARSWIRDGALMSEALLRVGHDKAVREFADWYAPRQFASGRIPCCVDARGADPVPENDSQGEWIHLVDTYFRYTGDRAWLAPLWPGVDRAVRFMQGLRSREAGPYAGLVAPSISHEGYSDQPAWSYWDDFWSLAGYDAATHIASALGKARRARAIALQGASLRRDIRASIERSVASHRIDYVPGSADRGDFDATSTTLALAPADAGDAVPGTLLRATFERYWREFVERRDGKRAWDAYTPYEWRNAGAFVRLGWRDRAQALVSFFMDGRRPAAWNQWAEVVGRDERVPRFIGDMPHAWVAADFMRSTLDLFAYERPRDRAMVLAAGVPEGWLDGRGVELHGLRTPWGTLGYALRREAGRITLTVDGSSAIPPGGLVLDVAGSMRCTGVTGATRHGTELRIDHAPARVEIRPRAGCAPWRSHPGTRGVQSGQTG